MHICAKETNVKVNTPMLKQSFARLVALALPLLLMLLARIYFEADDKSTFFTSLTDSILLLAFLRLGVNVYVPSLDKHQGKILISRIYVFAVVLLTTITLTVGLVCIKYFELNVYGLLVAGACIPFFLLGEINRAQSKFFSFYFLKAPVVYCCAFVLALAGDSYVTFFLLYVMAGLITYSVFNNITFTNCSFPASIVVNATITSVLITLFSWKEAAVGRMFLDSATLEVLVFYTRLKVLTTFVYMLYNARVPNVMRKRREIGEAVEILAVARKNIKQSLLWGILCSVAILVAVELFDKPNLTFVVIICSSSILTIMFGNIAQALIANREVITVALSHLLSVILFVMCFFILNRLTEDLLSVAISALFAQFALGICLYFFAFRIDKASKLTPVI